MKVSRISKRITALFMVVLMCIALVGNVAYASNVDELIDEEASNILESIQPRAGVNIIYPQTKSFTTGKKLTRLHYTVKAYPTNGFVLIRLTNRADGTYYNFSLMNYLADAQLPTNIEAGTYDITITGGNYSSLEQIMMNFSS